MDLKPCPFCGGEAEIRYAIFDYNRWGAQCNECGAYMEADEDSQEAVAAKWNQRTTPERKKAYWVYEGMGYKDHNRCLDLECFVCGGCLKQRERTEHRWGRDLTPPQKKFCSNCGAEMNTAKIVTKDMLWRGTL